MKVTDPAQSSVDDAAIIPADFHQLIGLIYDGPMEAVPWQASMEFIRKKFQANHALLILRPTSPEEPGLQITASGDRAIVTTAGYYDYGYALDPFIDLPEGRVVCADELVGTEKWTSCQFFVQFVQTADIRYVMGANLRTPGGIECCLRLCRPKESDTFSVDDKAQLQLLLPHFRRAVHLHSHLDVLTSERELYAATVNRMMVGTLLFDETGKLLRINNVAEEILAANDGLILSQGTLVATYYSSENQELQRLFKQSLAGATCARPRVTEAVAVTRPSGSAKLGIIVQAVPLSEWSEGRHRPAVVVFIRDPERKSDASTAVMRRLFDLTPAEAELALLLSSGETLDEAAEKLSIRKNTARAHLRSIFSKTGVTRQTALVHVLLNSVMNLH